MDKYEFNIAVEQIKKAAKNGDYAGAMKQADGIDWRRVSSVNLLTQISEIYEKNADYSEAKEILLLAKDRAPIGKRLLYKLTILALNEGNVPEAEAYYREFYDLAPEDPRQHILRYLILKAKAAPNDQLINTLEQYTREELDEQWMYELAELYHKAGRSDECVAMCDKIMLMFGIGNYVDKAIDLKLHQEGRPLDEYQTKLLENRDRYEMTPLEEPEEEPQETVPVQNPMPQQETLQQETIRQEKPQQDETILQEAVQQEAAQQKQENSETTNSEDKEMTIYTVNFIVERRKEEAGVEAAIRLLRLMHEHTGSTNMVAKIKAEKLNQVGVLASREKLAGKDLVVERAGDLTYSMLEEVMELIKSEPEDRVVVLIDNPMQIRKMLSAYPELLKLFHIDKEEETAVPEQAEEKPVQAPAPVKKTVKAPVKEETAEADEAAEEEETAAEPVDDTEELSVDDFANFAQEYAESIDCSISGKSKLALLERTEIMEEDGIPLTRANAVALIEEAADLAEKKTIGSLFKAQYDKNDKLILREEHFIN